MSTHGACSKLVKCRVNHSMKNPTYFFQYKASQAKQNKMFEDLLKQAIISKKSQKI
jgi:hypothetical protein